MSDTLKTPFYDCHVAAGGKLVDFAGWSLPVHYGSLVDEHHAVRNDAGVFDVSHMVLSDIVGESSVHALQNLATNDVTKLADNSALYSCLCDEHGGVVDDIIVYRVSAAHYRVVSNAATRIKVLDWFGSNGITEIKTPDVQELAMLAVQGPNAVSKAQKVLNSIFDTTYNIEALPKFGCLWNKDVFVGRTGYTGEDGVEITVPKPQATRLWNGLVDAGVKPCGLGARDTLRLEAGMSLYGNDLSEEHSPFDSGVGWTVDFSDETRQFIGREALHAQKSNGSNWLRIGLELQDRGVLRAGQSVQIDGSTIGVVTSGTFSPSLQRTIALARVNRAQAPAIGNTAGDLSVVIRNKPIAATRVPVPFLRNT